MQTTLVKYALALDRHQMGFRGPVGDGSGFNRLSARQKADVGRDRRQTAQRPSRSNLAPWLMTR
jgi:hypothetical protein